MQMLYKELENELVNVHTKLRNELTDILTMINIIGDDCDIVVSNKVFMDRNVSDFYIYDAFDDCKRIREKYPIINEKALAIEKEFLEKLFLKYEDIQSCWFLSSYITTHALIYSAILFRTIVHFNAFNIYLISRFLETYPYKYEYHLEYGNDLLNLYNGVLRNCNINEEINRQYNYVFDKSIAKSKWYILREYHRNLLDYNYDVNYFENVFSNGFETKQKAIYEIENMSKFIPRHYKINNCCFGITEYIEFF